MPELVRFLYKHPGFIGGFVVQVPKTHFKETKNISLDAQTFLDRLAPSERSWLEERLPRGADMQRYEYQPLDVVLEKDCDGKEIFESENGRELWIWKGV
jgi:hypothetical protein